MGKVTDPFYEGDAWRRLRQRALDRDHGFCVWCLKAGRRARDRRGRLVPVMADTVHHIKPRKTHPELEYELDNLVSLCRDCHGKAHPEKFAKCAKPKLQTAAQRLGVKFEQL